MAGVKALTPMAEILVRAGHTWASSSSCVVLFLVGTSLMWVVVVVLVVVMVVVVMVLDLSYSPEITKERNVRFATIGQQRQK